MPTSSTHQYGHLARTNTWDAQQTLAAALNLTGGQIAFPATQVASSDAHTFDDYEEGTWTPVIGGSTSETGQSYANQNAAYIKLGRLVIVYFNVGLSAKGTITGNLRIKGIPFSIDSNLTNFDSPFQASWQNMANNYVNILFRAVTAGSDLRVYGNTAASTDFSTQLTTTAITDTTLLRGSVFYLSGD
jgi:hypothetical protein